MTVPSAYFTSTKNTAEILTSIQKAGVPETLTYEFLKQLGYASSSDRATIPVLKALGFLDAGGRPTSRYREYKDPGQSRVVMATAIRAAYKDLFAVDTEAHKLSTTDLAGMFSRLSDKGSTVTSKMATTFKTLAELADFDGEEAASDPPTDGDDHTPTVPTTDPLNTPGGGVLSLRHDIHVHLPLSTDIAVYDAIFRSLKANLT